MTPYFVAVHGCHAHARGGADHVVGSGGWSLPADRDDHFVPKPCRILVAGNNAVTPEGALLLRNYAAASKPVRNAGKSSTDTVAVDSRNSSITAQL